MHITERKAILEDPTWWITTCIHICIPTTHHTNGKNHQKTHKTYQGSCSKIFPSQSWIWYTINWIFTDLLWTLLYKIWKIALEIPNELKMSIGVSGVHLLIRHKAPVPLWRIVVRINENDIACEWRRFFSLRIWGSCRVYLYAKPERFDSIINCESMRIRHKLNTNWHDAVRCNKMQHDGDTMQ